MIKLALARWTIMVHAKFGQKQTSLSTYSDMKSVHILRISSNSPGHWPMACQIPGPCPLSYLASSLVDMDFGPLGRHRPFNITIVDGCRDPFEVISGLFFRVFFSTSFLDAIWEPFGLHLGTIWESCWSLFRSKMSS